MASSASKTPQSCSATRSIPKASARTLQHPSAGPHTTEHLETLAARSDPALAAAAVQTEPWLHAAIGRLVHTDAHVVDEDTVLLLAQIAAYRQRWHVTHADPLGIAATTTDQATERNALATALASARARQ